MTPNFLTVMYIDFDVKKTFCIYIYIMNGDEAQTADMTTIPLKTQNNDNGDEDDEDDDAATNTVRENDILMRDCRISQWLTNLEKGWRKAKQTSDQRWCTTNKNNI